MGVKVAENVEPNKILFYIKAMWLTFRTYGNYENRGKARTRYMQEALGGAENYAKAYNEKLQEVSKIKTAKFCHNACFICTAETKEDAIKMAEIAQKA